MTALHMDTRFYEHLYCIHQARHVFVQTIEHVDQIKLSVLTDLF